MNKHILQFATEEIIIFFSVLKWAILSVLVGLIVGATTAVYLLCLEEAMSFTSAPHLYLFLLAPTLVISAFIIYKYGVDLRPRGTEKIIKFTHSKEVKIPMRVIPLEFFTAITTLSSGGSAGKEGPVALISAAISNAFARLFGLSVQDRKKIVVCGASAAFASVFGTPIAGALFGIEVLFVGKLQYNILLPALISGMISFEVTKELGIEHLLFQIPAFDFEFFTFIKFLIASVFFGLVSIFIVELFKATRRFLAKFSVYILRPLLAALVLILIGQFISEDALGLGAEHIETMLLGQPVDSHFFLTKSVTTALTINAGGGGGIITPIFIIGAAAGNFIATILDFPLETLAAVGLVSVLAGATNTPVSSSILSVELFGPEIAPFATIACVISFLMTGYRSAFPSQVLAMDKSQAVTAQHGASLDQQKVHVEYQSLKSIVRLKEVFKKRK